MKLSERMRTHDPAIDWADEVAQLEADLSDSSAQIILDNDTIAQLEAINSELLEALRLAYEYIMGDFDDIDNLIEFPDTLAIINKVEEAIRKAKQGE